MNQPPKVLAPSLPAVIGSTENALRALLSETLAATSIPDYAAWVILNIVGSAHPGALRQTWQRSAADALKTSRKEIQAIATRLTELGLLDTSGSLTAAGSSELTSARTAVSASVARLVEGIDEEQQVTTRLVLDQIRHRAEQSLDALLVRPAHSRDWPAIWRILREVAADGETFAMDADPPEESARADWMTSAPGRVVVAVDGDGDIVGTANMYRNRPNQGSHVASGSLMVASHARGRGIGRALVRDMISWTSAEGFSALQFNAVVQSNSAAVALYRSEGFVTIGVAPGAFRHPSLGPVDLLIMWRDLDGRRV